MAGVRGRDRRPEWAANPRFADAYRRKVNEASLDERIADWTRERTNREATDLVQAAGVAAFPAAANEEFWDDPHWHARNTWTAIDHPLRDNVTIRSFLALQRDARLRAGAGAAAGRG